MALKTVTFTIEEDLARDCKINAVKEDVSLSIYIRGIVTDAISPLEPEVMEVQKSETLLEKLENAFGSKAIFPKKSVVKHPKIRKSRKYNSRNPNDKWICPESDKKPYVNMEYQRGVIYTNRSQGGRIKLRSMEDILYAKKIMGDKGYFTNSERKEIGEKIGMSQYSRSNRFCWHIQEGLFDDFIKKQSEEIKSAKFTAKDGYLYISGEDSEISVSNAEAICYSIINCNDREKCISLNLRAYPHLNPYYIRCICENYSNDDLFEIIRKSNKKNAFIENNPSKRRNMIRNSVFV